MLSSMTSQSQSFAAQASMAMSQGQSSASAPSKGSGSPQDLRAAAEKFSGMFMSQMFQHMFDGVGTNKMFGGGAGEDMFKSVLTDEYGKAAAKSNSLGLTDQIMHALISQQEVKS